jgi:AsmA family/AsmA-like C-terminal region
MGSEKRSRGRTLAVVSAGLVAIVLVAYLALIVVFRAILDPRSLADRAEPHISAALNRRVDIGSAALSIFPRPEVRLLRLRIENLPDFEGMPLATVDELRLRPRLLPLLRKRVEIDRVLAVGPRVLLQVDEQGKTNFGDFVPASRDEAAVPETPLSLEIRGIELVEGRVGYRDAVSERSFQADGLRIEGSVERDAEGRLALDLESEVDSLRFSYPPAWQKGVRGLRVRTEIEAVAGPKFGWIEVASGTATINGLTVEVTGRADSLKSERRLFDFAVRGNGVELSRLISSLPDSVRKAVPVDLWGELGVDLVLRGALGPDEFPDVSGLVTVRGGGVRRGADRPLLESLDADVTIGSARAEITRLRASLPGGSVSATGDVALDSTLAFDLSSDGRADAAALAAASGTGGPDRSAVTRGSVRWNVTARGSAGRPAATSLTGEIGLEGLAVEGGSLVRPVEVASATVRLEGTGAKWNDVTVLAAGDPMKTSGSLRDLLGQLAEPSRTPSVEASISAARLDLDALIGPARAEIGYGRIAWARLAERPLQGRAAEDWAAEQDLRRPGPLPVVGHVAFRADSVLRMPYRLSGVVADLQLHPDRIDLTDVRFAAYGGTGTASGALHLGDVDSEPFQLDVSLSNVRAERYLAENTPLGTLISGSLSMDLALEGGVDRMALPVTSLLNGAGRFEIRDGRIAPNALTDGLLRFLRLESVRDLRFSRWNSPFQIRDGLIVLDGSDFSGSELVAELQGALGFGGSLDLGALIRPDSALASAATVAAGAAGAVIDRYLKAGGALELAVRLTGEASSPRFELDPEAMQESSRTVLEQAGQRALQSGEAQVRERGRELLRGLAGQKPAAGAAAPDTTPAAGPDSAAPPGENGGSDDPGGE